MSLKWHGQPIEQPDRAANDAIKHPQPRDPRHSESERYAHDRDRQQQRDHHPNLLEPIRAYLPTEVRFEEGAARIAAPRVVDDDGVVCWSVVVVRVVFFGWFLFF